LLDGVVYQFSIKSENAIGTGPLSSVVEIYAATIPEAPSPPTLVSQSASSITIAWSEL
jgi:hypothetical protein